MGIWLSPLIGRMFCIDPFYITKKGELRTAVCTAATCDDVTHLDEQQHQQPCEVDSFPAILDSRDQWA